MKRTPLLTFLLAASITTLAQNVSFGPTIGINNPWITETNNQKVSRSTKLGMNTGVSFTYCTNQHWAFGADLKYSMEGNKINYTLFFSGTGGSIFNAVAVIQRYKVEYVRLPLKTIYFFGKNGQKLRPKLYAGPSFGFLLSAKTKFDGQGLGSSETDLKDSFKGFDFGLLIGAGFNYQISKVTSLNLDLGYTNGFMNVYKDNFSSSACNRNLSLNVGVAFPIGKINPSTKETRKR